jgi:ABC-2 type transport system permease protein
VIGTVARVSWLRLRRSPIDLMVVFAVPMVFFSIFALIFGGQSRGDTTGSVDLVVVDEDRSDYSDRLIAALEAETALEVHRADEFDLPPGTEWNRDAARQLVRDGEVPVALVLPAGLADSFPGFQGESPHVVLLSDPSDPIAPQVAGGLLQKAMMTAMPTELIRGGADQFETAIGGLSDDQRASFESWMSDLEVALDRPPDEDREAAGFAGFVDVRVEDVLGDADQDDPLISFYAAAIAVMFLLFSTSGGGGSLLEEEESQTLERLLSTNLTMGKILLGKWIQLVGLGIVQITLMFLWGWLVFDLDFFSHLPGFAIMTLVTAAAASGFGLVLATACRSRGQLSGISMIVILSMSAVGGSMFPRFLMSDTMQRFGLVTFNAWAIDGYTKVFWRDAVLVELWPQVSVLALLSVIFMLAARLLARRWETI